MNQWTEEIEKLRTENEAMRAAIRELVSNAGWKNLYFMGVRNGDVEALSVFLEGVKK